ncbi:Maf family protein [Nitrospira moscoviensis]|uniref:dTTP/UTP pyrophosphatase n=1 Tax=Nitrospira moscoviensis TaxID=42253 RepID=A0A0K2GI87_NITMO|nr:Maf family protein [Nitrospira moscoviensis]ALA60660.1 Maf-like protein [Nitrospira moscoviensis]
MQLILASTSPRRRELLALLGLSFELCPPSFEEHPIAGLAPVEQVSRFAMEKAHAVGAQRPEDLVLGSDTVIEIDGQCVGKPTDMDHARAMLAKLAGRPHLVHTAVALCRHADGMERVEVASATVVMKPDDGMRIERYLATRESLGKAGAYSIQGWGGELIERIEGDFTAVVGLPLRMVARLLRSAGYDVPCDVEALYRRRPYPNWSRFST